METADLYAAFDYDVIAAVVAWNYPDHDHTRLSAREILHDLVECAIREHDEQMKARADSSSGATT